MIASTTAQLFLRNRQGKNDYILRINDGNDQERKGEDEWLRYLPLNSKVVGSSPAQGHDQDSSYDNSTGWFQDADFRVINLSCEILIRNSAKINIFKLKESQYNIYLDVTWCRTGTKCTLNNYLKCYKIISKHNVKLSFFLS